MHILHATTGTSIRTRSAGSGTGSTRRTGGVEAPEAMALATATPGGKPSVRMVLLKGADERGFAF